MQTPKQGFLIVSSKFKLSIRSLQKYLSFSLIDYEGLNNRPAEYELKMTQDILQKQFYPITIITSNLNELFLYLNDQRQFEVLNGGKIKLNYSVFPVQQEKKKSLFINLKPKQLSQIDQIMISISKFRDQTGDVFKKTEQKIQTMKKTMEQIKKQCFEHINNSLSTLDKKIDNITGPLKTEIKTINEKLQCCSRRIINGSAKNWVISTQNKQWLSIEVNIKKYNFKKPPLVLTSLQKNKTNQHYFHSFNQITNLTPQSFKVTIKVEFYDKPNTHPVSRSMTIEIANQLQLVLNYALISND